MLLAIDAGNTEIAAGVFDGALLATSFRLHTEARASGDELGLLFTDLLRRGEIEAARIHAVVVSNVVPALGPAIEELSRRHLGCAPLLVGADVVAGMRLLVDEPHEVGGDRIANALAARTVHGKPVVVVDFGTATTFDAVSAAGDYLGGAIAPGILLSEEALVRRAARLGPVDLVAPEAAIGHSTTSAMQSGLVHGYAGLVEGLVARIRRELGGEAKVVATGGLARQVSGWTGCVDIVDEHLTLVGLRLVHEMNGGR